MLKITLVAALFMCCATQHSMAERSIPKPRLKPTHLVAPDVGPPAAKNLSFPKIGILPGWSRKIIVKSRRDCAQLLQGLNIEYTAMAPIGQEGGCGAAAPLLVTSIAGVTVEPPAELTCPMAEALHGWISGTVLPGADKFLNKRLVKINNASAYACRRRNNARSGKLSEHGKVNALDISSLEFADGSQITIKGDWSGLRQLVGANANGKFLREIRRFACIRFTTVLGPGSDAFHKDHFHIDKARRNSGYRICK